MHAYQQQVNQKLKDDPNIGQFFTLDGFAARTASSQGLIFGFLEPRSDRLPIEQCIPQLQKSISSIPGITAILQPNPVLQINVGATSQTQGQDAYTLSGIVPDEVYAAADQLMTKLKDFKGFSSVRSDYYT